MILWFHRLTVILFFCALLPLQGAEAHLFDNLRPCKIALQVTTSTTAQLRSEYSALVASIPLGQRTFLRGLDFFRFAAATRTTHLLQMEFERRVQEACPDPSNCSQETMAQVVSDTAHQLLEDSQRALVQTQSYFRFGARLTMIFGFAWLINKGLPPSLDALRIVGNYAISVFLAAGAEAGIRRWTELVRADGWRMLSRNGGTGMAVLGERGVQEIGTRRQQVNGLTREGVSILFNVVQAAERALESFYEHYASRNPSRLEFGYARIAGYLLYLGRYNPEFNSHLEFVQTPFRLLLLEHIDRDGRLSRAEVRAGVLRYLSNEIDVLNAEDPDLGLRLSHFKTILNTLIPDLPANHATATFRTGSPMRDISSFAA